MKWKVYKCTSAIESRMTVDWRSTCTIESQAELASLSWNIILLERINEKLLLFRHGYLGNTLSKMIKVNLSEEETDSIGYQR